MSNETFAPFDSADYLNSFEDVTAYLEAVLDDADDDPSVRVTRGLLDISRSVDALQTIAAQSSGAGEKLGEQVARHSLLIGKPLATIARHLSEPAPASAESQALTHLAQQLQDGHAQAQTQLRDALAATTASLKA